MVERGLGSPVAFEKMNCIFSIAPMKSLVKSQMLAVVASNAGSAVVKSNAGPAYDAY